MIRVWREWIRGSWIAVTSPLWLDGSRLRSLMSEPPAGPAPSADPFQSCRASLAVLRRLSSVPLSPWKYTCLYRSVSVCRCLRSCGLGARLQLGARPSSRQSPGVSAHAWVEIDSSAGVDGELPVELVGSRGGHVLFESPSGSGRPEG